MQDATKIFDRFGSLSYSQSALIKTAIGILLISLGVSLFVGGGKSQSSMVEQLLEQAQPQQSQEQLDETQEAENAPPGERQRAAVHGGDYFTAVRLILPYWGYQLSHVATGTVVLAVFSGLFWWLFVLSYARPGPAWPVYVLISAIAIALGAFSTQLTLLAALLQKELLGFDQRLLGDGMLQGFAYCIFGIGLREEFTKLLVFLPLIPYLMRQNRPALWLLSAGCVGLGFAIEENLNYIAGGMNITARFLTANFFHMTLTALVGYQAVRAARQPREHLDEFLQTLALAVVVHGVYNALMMVPQVGDGSFFSLMAFVLLAYRYFQVLRSHRPTGQSRFSLTSIFTIGLVSTIGGALIYLSTAIGVIDAALALGNESAGVAIICFLYFQQVNEPLHP